MTTAVPFAQTDQPFGMSEELIRQMREYHRQVNPDVYLVNERTLTSLQNEVNNDYQPSAQGPEDVLPPFSDEPEGDEF